MPAATAPAKPRRPRAFVVPAPPLDDTPDTDSPDEPLPAAKAPRKPRAPRAKAAPEPVAEAPTPPPADETPAPAPKKRASRAKVPAPAAESQPLLPLDPPASEPEPAPAPATRRRRAMKPVLGADTPPPAAQDVIPAAQNPVPMAQDPVPMAQTPPPSAPEATHSAENREPSTENDESSANSQPQPIFTRNFKQRRQEREAARRASGATDQPPAPEERPPAPAAREPEPEPQTQPAQPPAGRPPHPRQQQQPQNRDRNRDNRGGRDRNRGRQGQNGSGRHQDGDADTPANGAQDHAEPLWLDDPDTPPQLGEGIIEISGKGFGFLRDPKRGFAQHPQDIFVTPEIVRRYTLRDGMKISGETRRSSRGAQLSRLLKVNDDNPERYQHVRIFEELTVLNPLEMIRLETTPDRLTTRVIDLMAPIGKGQRGLLVAPPRTGKTTLLEHIAQGVLKNHPDMPLLILLVDERPEEVTELKRALPKAEVWASSNDSDVKNHTRIAQMCIDRAKRLVEGGRDVFLLLDSITRLGRAFNNALTGGGKTMSGGMDSKAMEIPRRLFAAARNTEEAGSLTIVATALVDTGSRMDEFIFQEFKGTGNMELVLDRKISDLRIYPAADIFQSGTRREELILPADELERIATIRRGLSGMKALDAIERLLNVLRKFPTNADMLKAIPAS